ncbi:MAG TPA: MBL fold metallo-hydrolase, partial [Thermoprotei archaeon]|nr:MBL fold metallo-hydrolase [Thermoprotei archaeon]
ILGGALKDLRNIVSKIKGVFITHAHLDHTGALPLLCKWGYDGFIYSTEPTRPLTKRLLLNSVKVSRNKPFFTVRDILVARERMRAVRFFEEVDLSGIKVIFYSSEHIIGSAMVFIKGEKRVLITSDFKWEKTMLHHGVQSKIAGSLIYEELERCDLMIMESSYGNKRLQGLKELTLKLSKEISSTVDKGGTVLIVTGAINKPAEVALMIKRGVEKNIIPKHIKVYIDGLAAKFYDMLITFRRFTRVKNSRVLSRAVKKVSLEEREELISNNEPKVIISSGEYLGGTTSLYYFKKLAQDPKNTIIFASSNIPEGTLAHTIVYGKQHRVFIEGDSVRINARVVTIPISLHSDYRGLVQFVKLIKPKKLVLIHGSKESKEFLARYLKNYDPVIASEVRLKI